MRIIHYTSDASNAERIAQLQSLASEGNESAIADLWSEFGINHGGAS